MGPPPRKPSGVSSDPLWYKDAVIYELHVRAFADSNGDGIGDFPGLTAKLDYLRDLGVTALWLLPFYPSPGRDDGYDIADYTGVNPAYGTLRDFETFVEEAHERDLRVITELVINHTSDAHPWFQRARKAAKGSSHRDFYVWSDDPTKWSDARIIFQDFEPSNWTFDREAQSYFWHRFYSHQPDLNFESPAVRRALFKVLDFWMSIGVDGMRLDAIPYLYERDGTNCENLPEGHEFLKSLRRHLDSRFEARLLLAEANQWPEDAAAYFGSGDECHMNFHFPLMPRLFMAIRMEDRFPVIDILKQTPEIPADCQWAVFLRNHDELTLEMVTDEERDYMYRVYATDPRARVNLGIRRRLAPLLGHDRRRIELMNGLLFSLPGTPVLYYGDEIGMGDNIYLGDRNGVRTPMQWSADRNAGFSRANPQRLYLPIIIDPEYHYETVNVEAQSENPHSLLWWTRRLISLRRRHSAFGRGTLEFLTPENRKVLAFIRRHESEQILVVANVSRFVQYVELDLKEHRGMVPVELFGRTDFPPIGDLPYLLTLGPHAFYWFSLERRATSGSIESMPIETATLPEVVASGSWTSLFDEGDELERSSLEAALPRFLASRRWFGGKAHEIKAAHVVEAIEIPQGGGPLLAVVVLVDDSRGTPAPYLLVLGLATGEAAAALERSLPQTLIARMHAQTDDGSPVEGFLFEALDGGSAGAALFGLLARGKHLSGWQGALDAETTRAFRQLRPEEPPPVTAIKSDQTHTSLACGDRFVLKVFRRVEAGVHPEVELGHALTEKAGFLATPPIAGAITLEGAGGARSTLAVLHGFVHHESDGWRGALDALDDFFDRVETREGGTRGAEPPAASLLELVDTELPAAVLDLVGPYLERAGLLGRRTAEMHLALASLRDPLELAPEPFSALYQRSLYQTMRNSIDHVFQLLRARHAALPADARELGSRVLALETEALRRCERIREKRIAALRTRIHGDYRLQQVLWTGKDFVVIDFEGEAARPLGERRIKRSPLADVAGMLRSFDDAAAVAADRRRETGDVGARPETLDRSARIWARWVASRFLGSYLGAAKTGSFLPASRDDLARLLDLNVLGRAIYELRYELENRPDWVRIPLRAIIDLIAAARGGAGTCR